MTDEAKQKAWRRLCSKMEALGIDPYSPQVPTHDSRFPQFQAILSEYKVDVGESVPVPPDWEGYPPLKTISALSDLAAWLNCQWISTLATEMGGERYNADAKEQAARAVRNGFRVLKWLDMDERPERPQPPDSLAAAKTQLDALERWVRQKVKEGWTPPQEGKRKEVAHGPGKTCKQRNRTKFPDECEVNIFIKRFLDQHPKATIRDVAEAVDLSVGKVQKTDVWRMEMARRKAAKPLPKVKERPLTRKMLASIGGNERESDDAAARIDAEDLVWRRIIEEADLEERASLYGLIPEQRKKLIATAAKQYADHLTEEGG